MRAMVLEGLGAPLRPEEIDDPVPGAGEALIRVLACGVCRTDLHIVDGELPAPAYPLVPGHQVAGRVLRSGGSLREGTRVGIPWLGWTCGECRFCLRGSENLCERAVFTGHGRQGGFAELICADERFCLPLPDGYPDLQAAPLLCAGLIGHRALRMAGTPEVLGIYGFGAAAHIVCQVAVHEGARVHAFTRREDEEAQAFALSLGAASAGDAEAPPPEPLGAAIIFAPVGDLVPHALRAVEPGGSVVCAGIHMSDIPSFPYEILWGERSLRSVANLTRADAEEFLALAPRVPVRTEVEAFPLDRAAEALDRLRAGNVRGAAVVCPGAA